MDPFQLLLVALVVPTIDRASDEFGDSECNDDNDDRIDAATDFIDFIQGKFLDVAILEVVMIKVNHGFSPQLR